VNRPTRRIYLTDAPLDEALAAWMDALRVRGLLDPLPGEPVPLSEAGGRVTAEAVVARRSVPHYHAAAMDGIAVRAADTFAASETTPVRLSRDRYVPVDTGDPLPEGTDAVVMIEDVHEVDGEAEITAAAVPWQHVRPAGEDVVATELLLPSNHVIRPVDLGALAAAGVRTVNVRRRPRVLVIPTGDEVVDPTGPLQPGQIPEFNTIMLAAEISRCGGEPVRHPVVPDDEDRLAQALGRAADYDLVLTNAGASAGSHDYTAEVFRRLGEVHVHGVAIRPAKPVILGIVHGRPAVGLPGYPVSAMLAFDLFVRPVLYALQGLAPPQRERLRATLVRKVHSTMGLDEFVRVTVGRVGDRVVAAPLSRGAGVVTSLVRADGWLVIPRTSEGLEAGAEVEIELLRPRSAIESTVLVVGSHDVALDVLADFLRRAHPSAALASAHVGSLGGLLALHRGEAHMAGIHLLDEATGEYNVPYVRRHLPDRAVTLVTLAHREQGLLVPPGNPKKIQTIADLARPGVRFINRQRGAGTRLLLDYELRRAGISPGQIQGYDREVYTHMAVAVAVATGAADVGLGILAAARAMGLDFVPVAHERFDLAIPEDYLSAPGVGQVLAVLERDDFRRAVAALGGYDLSRTGTRLSVEPTVDSRPAT
jgi:putative molybdopterin biosynthesis protein